MRHKSRQRVVVIGGGYAGVRAARDLGRLVGDRVEVVLVAASASHVDVSSLYEVATAYVPRDAHSLRDEVRAGVHVSLAELLAGLPITLHVSAVRHISLRDRLVELADATSLSFDWLVLALGATLRTYGIPGVATQAFSLRSLHEAARLRHHIVRQVMIAADLSGEARRAARTFLLVGGGAAGVEAAAELVGLLRQVTTQYGFDVRAYHIHLLEAGSDVLRDVPEPLRRKAERRLESLGVEVRKATRVVAVEPGGVRLGDGRFISTGTVVWTAGLAPAPLLEHLGLPLTSWGVAVNRCLQVNGYPLVFAAGDCAIVADTPQPATVPVAYDQGSTVARNIAHMVRREPLEVFSPHRRGQIITLGGKRALLVLPGGKGYVGFSAWLVKKLVVLRYWCMYLTFPRALGIWWQGLRAHSRND